MNKPFENIAEFMQALLDGKTIESTVDESATRRLKDGHIVTQNDNRCCGGPYLPGAWRIRQEFVEKSGWVNVFANNNPYCGHIFDTKEEAQGSARSLQVDTVQIAWKAPKK